jgi:hypothetical protein
LKIQCKSATIPRSRALEIIDKEKGTKLPKNSSTGSLVDREGWKVSMLKGMHVARMPILNQSIWLKESRLSYVMKKFMIMVVLIETMM